MIVIYSQQIVKAILKYQLNIEENVKSTRDHVYNACGKDLLNPFVELIIRPTGILIGYKL